MRVLPLALLAPAALAQNSCQPAYTAVKNILAGSCGDYVRQNACPNGGTGGGNGNGNGSGPTTTTTTTTRATTTTTTPAPPVNPAPAGDAYVGTYFPNWFVYKKIYMGINNLVSSGSGQLSQDYVVWPSQLKSIYPKITHMFYAFLDLNANCHVVDGDPDAAWYGTGTSEPSWIQVPSGACKGLFVDMMAMKAQFPHLKLVVSLGGWTYSSNFSACAAKGEEAYKKIYNSFTFYLSNADKNWGKPGGIWSGIDFDWEHPGTAGDHQNFDRANDWNNYAKMVQYFRNRANSEGRTEAVFSTAIGAGDTLDLMAQNPSAAATFCQNLDIVNLMTYDLHGKWVPQTGHNAQFCQIDSGSDARPEVSHKVPWSVKDRINLLLTVCPANKVAVGFPNYTPAWAGVPSTNDGLYQTSTLTPWAVWSTFSDKDEVMDPQGQIHWWDLKKTMAADSSLRVFSKSCPADMGISVPVKWVYSSSKQVFACYEDAETVKAKAQWARAKGLKGIFFWDASQDKEGELLDAGRAGFGITTIKNASGSGTCPSGGRPDYDKDPEGNYDPLKECRQTGKTYTAVGGDGCKIIGDKTKASCNGNKGIAVGGKRSWGGDACVQVCSNDWGAGKDMLQVGDTIYFVCSRDEVTGGGSSSGSNHGNGGNNGGNGGNNNGGGSSGGSSGSKKRCAPGCASCTRGPGCVNAGPACDCNACIGGHQYWPCNEEGLCYCD